MTTTCEWSLTVTQRLTFTVNPWDAVWNDVPGIYILAHESTRGPNGWRALYIGQTRSFSKVIPPAETLLEARRQGATHVHAAVVHEQTMRDLWVTRLAERLRPPLGPRSARSLNDTGGVGGR